jgi:ubiquinone/menaquinone biosynthesis C-methylase UbiE
MDKKTYSEVYTRRWRQGGGVAELNRQRAWDALVQIVFSKIIPRDSVVLDLACGQGGFINSIDAKEKIAIDYDIDASLKLTKGIHFYPSNAIKIEQVPDATCDFVFTSNFFEHLNSIDELLECLLNIRRVLKPGNKSKLIIMMPNVNLVKFRFFDFIDHKLLLNPSSLTEALQLRNFQVDKSVANFFPYSAAQTKVLIPKMIFKIYLHLPGFLRFKAGQMLFIASPNTA